MPATLVYTDYPYHRVGGEVYSERAFSLFLAAMAADGDLEMTIMGRLDPEAEGGRYAIGEEVAFLPLPHYASLVSFSALRATASSLRLGVAAIRRSQTTWLLGPHPLMIPLAIAGLAMRRRIVLGVRQDTPAYVAARHPGRRLVQFAARLFDRAFRLLARACPTVVVGPALAGNYSHAHELLEISVSLVRADDIASREEALATPEGPRTLLFVGRLETEKNPLALATILDRLVAAGGDWRLRVCGEGNLADELERELAERGLSERVEMLGYVPYGPELRAVYREAEVLINPSWTEGLPQVLLEAMAAGLPVAASNVGGIATALGDAVETFTAGDVDGSVAAVEAVARDGPRRAMRIEAGLDYIAAHTMEIEAARAARFVVGDRR
jgi:glycosyltransferase involved in cell wall biosynthesis